MDLKLQGRTALVLGSSSGIGRGIAAALADEGCRVAICSRSGEKLEKAKAQTGAEITIQLDLSSEGGGARAVEQALARFSRLDILVTNTGGPAPGDFLKVSPEDWQRGFSSLCLSAVQSIHAAIPSMIINRWGRVILITSVAAKEPISNLIISNVLRAGLLGLTKSLSKEVAPSGITVNSILPGYTRTERLLELGINEEELVKRIPAARLGTPEELGKLAAFLCSEHAGFITGQAIAYDGGMLQSI